ncbi:imidazolonepropionase [Bradyrhizobium sp.]|uniref:imidazolonepropionase n=1 Tax=Bradyrhizobium sp. TaxID=376 RepID=UPI003C647432
MSELKVLKDAALAVSGGLIDWVGARSDWTGEAAATLDLGGVAVLPGLIDPHTHAVWAGDRLADFEARVAGATYEQILLAGGGIRSTVRATAAASQEELVALAKPRVEALLRSGATTIEVKSGYGFAISAEIAMLDAIAKLAAESQAGILATLLIHLPPKEVAERLRYVEQVCVELIPEVARRGLATAVDVFVEREAWHVGEAEQMFVCAKNHGLAVKLHSDQFHSIGGVELGVRIGALSVDHLEAAGEEQIAAIASSGTMATILPGVSLHLGIPAAPGRRLIDAGAAVAVGTDLNPGSSPLYSTAAALGLAVRMNGLTAQEAIVAGTLNAACALGVSDRGRIEAGCMADFVVLHEKDWRELVYVMGANPVREVWVGGRRVVG